LETKTVIPATTKSQTKFQRTNFISEEKGKEITSKSDAPRLPADAPDEPYGEETD